MQEEKILIIKFGGLGDIILSLDALFSIYSHHKNKKIVLLTEKPFKIIFSRLSFLSEIVTIKRSLFYLFDLQQIKNKVSFYNFSHVYDLQTSKRTSYYLKYFFKRGVVTNGLGKYAEIEHINPKRDFMHTIDRQKDQLKLSNIRFRRMKNYEWLSDNNIQLPKLRFALIIPGGSKSRPYKRIPKDIYKRIIHLLLKKNIKPILVGSKDDEKICRELSLSSKEVLNLCRKTSVGHLFFLAKNSLLSVGNDTGPMHIIARANNKTIVFFTKFSDASLCQPIGRDVEIFKYQDCVDDFYLKIKKSLTKLI